MVVAHYAVKNAQYKKVPPVCQDKHLTASGRNPVSAKKTVDRFIFMF
jgi:hypothetical protein